jgi:ankyrin repeat protein
MRKMRTQALGRKKYLHIGGKELYRYNPHDNPMQLRQPARFAGLASTLGAVSLFLFILYASGIAHAGPLEQKLIDAAFMGKVDTARDLIARGADVNARDQMGNPVLLTAVRPYASDMVRLLVENGADVNAAGTLEETPLLSAARKELPEIVRILLDAGADPNYARSDGGTALMEACIFGHREVVELLVDGGADISAKDQFGFTPLSIAKKNNHTGIVKYLKEKGAAR